MPILFPASLMIYPFLKLETALFIVGLFLLVSHALALWKPQMVKGWLIAFPRSPQAGFVLITAAAIWFFILVKVMDLGEFSNWRRTVLIGTPIAWYLTWKYVDEFLAVRALGMLVILAAEPLLESGFLSGKISALLLKALVFVWIVFAMFWVGMPYTLRDQIGWVTRSETRWRAAALAGIIYGALLAGLSIL